eukprot:888103-Alexandrium_andersonii.AAC.1
MAAAGGSLAPGLEPWMNPRPRYHESTSVQTPAAISLEPAAGRRKSNGECMQASEIQYLENTCYTGGRQG